MQNPSQIAEMANNAAKEKYKIELMATDSGRLGYDLVQNLKHTIADFKQTYIAAFTDAMELMSKEWVSVDTPPVDSSTLSGDVLQQLWQVAMDDHILLLPCQYYKGKWYAYSESGIEDRVKWYRPLPEPPVINKP